MARPAISNRPERRNCVIATSRGKRLHLTGRQHASDVRNRRAAGSSRPSQRRFGDCDLFRSEFRFGRSLGFLNPANETELLLNQTCGPLLTIWRKSESRSLCDVQKKHHRRTYCLTQSQRSDGELGVFRPIDHTHPASAELLENAVVRNGLAEHGATARIIVSSSVPGHNLLSRIFRLRLPSTRDWRYGGKNLHWKKIPRSGAR